MLRRSWWYGCLTAVLATAMLLTGGCTELAMTIAYLYQGTDVGADYPGLKGKKVVVVCRPMTSVTYYKVGKQLSSQISVLLKQNVSKITVVEQQKVAEWTDENQWNEYPEVGKAMKADMVVGVDLTSFSTYQGPTLYQGKATASIKVYDLKDDNKVVYEKELPQILYPPNIGIPISDKSEADFGRDFTSVVADLIARHFYSHDEHADVAQDAAAWLN